MAIITNQSNFLNTIVKIYDNSVDISKINMFLNQIRNNTAFCKDDIYNGLVIECYSDKDFPSNLSAGLYYPSAKLIQMKIPSVTTDDYISNLLSHEFGHHWSGYIKWGISSLIYNEWKKYRGVDSNSSTPQAELIAEDFRLLFGSEGAKNYQRGNYTQAVNKTALKQFYESYRRCFNYLKPLETQFVFINNLSYKYENDNWGMMFYEDWGGFLNFWSDHWTYINNAGIFHYINNNWVKINE